MSFSRKDIREFFKGTLENETPAGNGSQKLILNETTEKPRRTRSYRDVVTHLLELLSKGETIPNRWSNGWEYFAESDSEDEDEDEEKDQQNEIYWGQVGGDPRDAEGGMAIADYPGPYATGEKAYPEDLYYEMLFRRKKKK